MEATLDNMLYTKGFYMTDFILASQKREVFFNTTTVTLLRKVRQRCAGGIELSFVCC